MEKPGKDARSNDSDVLETTDSELQRKTGDTTVTLRRSSNDSKHS